MVRRHPLVAGGGGVLSELLCDHGVDRRPVVALASEFFFSVEDRQSLFRVGDGAVELGVVDAEIVKFRLDCCPDLLWSGVLLPERRYGGVEFVALFLGEGDAWWDEPAEGSLAEPVLAWHPTAVRWAGSCAVSHGRLLCVFCWGGGAVLGCCVDCAHGSDEEDRE